jgi:predicted RNA-binding Zn-ribbon protein involved in translation (DUF1610 family)
MATEKQDPSFTKRFILPLVGIFVVSSSLGIVAILAAVLKHERLGIALFCILLVVTVTGLAVLHNRVLGHYQCPQCHAELPRHKVSSRRSEYLFYCKNCDVLWKPGLKQGA